jgi:hypothetical protein
MASLTRFEMVIHGVRVRVTSDCQSVLKDLAHDFHYFARRPTKKRAFEIQVGPGDSDSLDWKKTFSLGRATFFLSPKKSQRVCFFGKAWVQYHFEEQYAVIRCDDKKIAYEVCYFCILAYAGEMLDKEGLHRLHGLGLNIDGTGAIVLAPSGTGKSTWAMRYITGSNAKLLSDDMPLIGPNNQMFAFPQRIALREVPEIPRRYVRKFSRARYGEKYVVGAEFFRKRIADRSPLSWLILTQRNGNDVIRQVSRFRLVWPLMKWLVIGFETPQIWELFVRPSPSDVLQKSHILARRLVTAARLVRSCRAAEFHISQSPEKSVLALEKFLSQ